MNKFLLITLSLFLSISWAFAYESGPFDEKRFETATIVLRVKFIEENGDSKYLWDRVKIVSVIKNASGQDLGDEISVAHYSWKAGIPKGRSTIYLEPYNENDSNMWRLLDGDGNIGVSHNNNE